MCALIIDWPTTIIAATAVIGILFGAFAWFVNVTISTKFSQFRDQLNGRYLSSSLAEEKFDHISSRLATFSRVLENILRDSRNREERWIEKFEKDKEE